MKRFFLIPLVLLNTALFGAFPESFGILAPYVGRISSQYTNTKYRLNLDESGTMTGVYGQWLNPDYQTNAFFYYAPNAQMSKVLGLHLNGDYYPLEVLGGKLAIGVDFEGIRINTVGAIKGLESLDLSTTVFTAMPRTGLQLELLKSDFLVVNAFPYVGFTHERVSGDVSVDPTGPTPKITTPISENSTYASLGANLTLRFFHFVELQGKYLAGLKTEGRLDSIGAMLNLYLSKSLAVSYRFKHIDLPKRSNEYHLLGIALII